MSVNGERLKKLLPPGIAFSGPITSALMEGISVEFGRVISRVADALLEMDPRTATETLPDWERVLGLPDPNAPTITATSDRQLAATQKYSLRGGERAAQSFAFLESIATQLGFSYFILRRFHLQPFTCQSNCDEALFTESEGWSSKWWEFIVPHTSNEMDLYFKSQIQQNAPSDVHKEFAFPILAFDEGTFARTGTAIFTDFMTRDEYAIADGELWDVYIGV